MRFRNSLHLGRRGTRRDGRMRAPTLQLPASSPAPPACLQALLRREPSSRSSATSIRFLQASPLTHSYWGVLARVVEDGRNALRPQREQADDAGVEHEDRDAGGGGRNAGLGLHGSKRGSSPPARSPMACSRGDLVVVGSGDPSLVAADGMADRVFGDWAARAEATRRPRDQRPGDRRRQRLRRGDARPRLDVGRSSHRRLGRRRRAAIQRKRRESDGRTGSFAGESAAVSFDRARGSGLTIVSAVTTAAAGTRASISTRRLPGSMRLNLGGIDRRSAQRRLR